MKKIILIFIISRLLLFLITFLSPHFILLRTGYLGKIGWDNMDGVHYTSIAQNGYFQYEQAFFPGYPFLIRLFSRGLGLDPSWVGFILSNIFALINGLLLYKLLESYFKPDNLRHSGESRAQSRDDSRIENKSFWSIIFLFAFPTSFFFSAVYTESFFLFLILSAFYFSHKQKYLLAGIFGALASFTRLVGIFLFPALLIEWWLISKKNLNSQCANALTRQCANLLKQPFNHLTIKPLLCLSLIPLGLLSYIYYLYISIGDPLFFFHSQPFFGAGRSGDRIILLPQVIFRYLKIFTTASLNYDYFIAILEILSLLLVIYLLLKNLKKIPLSWRVFSWLSLITPTLTGSLSSMPRYILTIFLLYYLLSQQSKIVRYILLILFITLQIILTSFFLQGYFVA